MSTEPREQRDGSPCNCQNNYSGIAFREIEKELEERKDFDPITHLVLQCGVGGFASAGAAYAYWNCSRWNKEKVML